MGLWIDCEGGLHALALMCSGGSTLWVLLGFFIIKHGSLLYIQPVPNGCGRGLYDQPKEWIPFLSTTGGRGTRAIGV